MFVFQQIILLCMNQQFFFVILLSHLTPILKVIRYSWDLQSFHGMQRWIIPLFRFETYYNWMIMQEKYYIYIIELIRFMIELFHLAHYGSRYTIFTNHIHIHITYEVHRTSCFWKLPHTKTEITLADCVFCCAAPKLWNDLPCTRHKKPRLLLSSKFSWRRTYFQKLLNIF